MNTDPLREEHNRLKAEARANRREFAKTPESAFVKEMREAIVGYLQMRAQGIAREDACKGLELVLRSAWPKKATKYPALCDLCDDTGWRLRTCTHQMRCERRFCREAHPAHEHDYVQACDCVAGDRKRARVVQVEDEIAAASRMAKKKPRGFSAIGR